MNSWLNNIQLLLFPGNCILCGAKGVHGLDLCSHCAEKLPVNSNACHQCALPLPEHGSTFLCGQCIHNPPYFQCSYALWRYESPVDHWISQLKFHQKLLYANLMGRLCAQQIRQAYEKKEKLPEVIIPVPLHAARLRERGFNQALEIARPISKLLNIPLDTTSCTRIKATEPQSLLSAGERKSNIKGAFQLAPGFSANHVAIVDDVMTTGQTMNELASILENAQVQRVDVWLCARAFL